MLHASPDAVLLIRAEGEILFASPAIASILGYEPEAALKLNVFQEIHPQDIGDMQQMMIQLMDRPAEPMLGNPIRLKHKKGTWIWTEISGTNMLLDPAVNALSLSIRDITHRRDLQAIKEFEQQNRQALINTSNDLIWSVDTRFRLITANSAFTDSLRDQYGITYRRGDDLVRGKWGPEYGAYWKALYERALAGESFMVESYAPSEDAEPQWFETKLNPIKDADGKVAGVACYSRDITRRKRQEVELQDLNDKLVAAQQIARLGYWQLFIPEERLQWSDEVYAIWGVEKGAFLPDFENFLETVHPDDRNEFLRVNNAALKGELELDFVHRIVRPDGTVRWVQERGKLLSEEVFAGTVQDVTERRTVMEQLRLANERFERAVEATNDSVWEWDVVTNMLYWGENYRKKYGATLDEQLKVDAWESRVHPDDAAYVIDSLQRKMNDKQARFWQCEYRYKEASGRYIYVADRASIIRNEKGKPLRLVGALQDVTRSKQDQMQRAMLSEISRCFNQAQQLKEALEQALRYITAYTGSQVAEVWLADLNMRKVNLLSHFSLLKNTRALYDPKHGGLTYPWSEGLPGAVLMQRERLVWEEADIKKNFVRAAQAEKAGIRCTMGVPLTDTYQAQVGTLVLAYTGAESEFVPNWDELGLALGTEIRRKLQEQELSGIFNAAPDIISIAGTDGYFKKVNPAMSELLGYSERELLSKPFIEFVHPEDRHITGGELDNLRGGQKVFAFENRYITKTGKIVWLSWTANSSPEEGLIYSVARDITESKHLEVLLKRASNLANIGSWEIDLRENVVYWSPLARKIYGVTADEKITPAKARKFVHPDYRELMSDVGKRTIDTGKPFDEEIKIVTRRGAERWVRIIGEVEYLNDIPVVLSGSIQDIHSRKESEATAIHVLKEKNSILERMNEAFFAVDNHWKVNYWNKKAEKVLGVPRRKVLNKHLWSVFSDSVDSVSYQMYHQAIKTGEVVNFEDYYPPVDKWYEISAYPSPTGLSVYFKDITERKISEIKLRELNNELEQKARELEISNKELEQFAYVASHDLQEPLRTITSFLTQLEKRYEGVLDEKGAKYIEFAVDGAKRMRQIILDILEFSRIGRGEEPMEEINLNRTVKTVVELNRALIHDLKAQVKVGKLPTVNGFQTPMQQVFQNLIGNALKYRHPERKPIVRVSCREYKHHWRLEVSDNGLGIDPQYAERVFQIFQRLHRRDEYPGTGMGLAITRKIVEHHGGEIRVKSNGDKGSVFYFTLPKT